MFDPPGPDDDAPRPTSPPAADDRLWRHPSEVAASMRADAPHRAIATTPTRNLRGQRFSLGTVFVAGSLGALAMFASLVGLGLVSGAVPATDTDGPAEAPGPLSLHATSGTPAPMGIVALRLSSADSVRYGVGLVVDQQGDIVTTLDVSAMEDGTALHVETPGQTWATAGFVARDAMTGLSVVSVGDAVGQSPANVAAPRMSESVVMLRPGAGAGASVARAENTRIAGTNVALTTTSMHCLGLTVLTSPRRTGPSEVALADDGETVVGLVAPLDDNPEDDISYAVPADLAVAVAHQLIADGQAHHGTFDATIATASNGAFVVTSVAAGGRAATSGLETHDEVLTVDGRRVHSPTDLAGALLAHSPDDTVTVIVRRGHRQTPLTVQLAGNPGGAVTMATTVAVDTTASG